jgi:hypothetical protein
VTLLPIEHTAVNLVFRGADDIDRQVRNQLAELSVVNRDLTGVGFFTTIRFMRRIVGIEEFWMRDYVFTHPDFPYGGSFNCRFVDDINLELEGVALGGATWPEVIDVHKFSELV